MTEYTLSQIRPDDRRAMKQLDQQRRRDAIRQMRERLEKDRRRRELTNKARAVLNRTAELADRLLGGDGRGTSMGANLRISSARDNDIQGN